MKYRVRHITEYQYNAPVTLCYNMAHLLPRDTTTQVCLNRQVRISPSPVYQRERTDYFNNQVLYFSQQEPHTKLIIDVSSEVRIVPMTPLDLTQGPTCGELRQQLQMADQADIRVAKEFLLDSLSIRLSQDLLQYAQASFADDKPVLLATREFTRKIFEEFTFDPTATTVATPLEEVLVKRRGVCQDFAHFAIGCLRSVGLPARYMSGYLETLPPPGQEKLTGADASHAWFAVYVPPFGWIEFDPTNDLIPTDQHIVTAWGRDYADVTPLQGVIFDGGDQQQLTVSVDVQRLEN